METKVMQRKTELKDSCLRIIMYFIFKGESIKEKWVFKDSISLNKAYYKD